MSQSILSSLETFGYDALVLDGRRPLLSMSTPVDELLLYHMTDQDWPAVSETYLSLSDQKLDPNIDCNTLSGGQQLMLGIAIALNAPVRRVLLHHCITPLHQPRRERLHALLAEAAHRFPEVKIVD